MESFVGVVAVGTAVAVAVAGPKIVHYLHEVASQVAGSACLSSYVKNPAGSWFQQRPSLRSTECYS